METSAVVRRYRLTLSIGFANAKYEEVIEIEGESDWPESQWDDAAEEEWRTWSANYIDGGIERVEDRDD